MLLVIRDFGQEQITVEEQEMAVTGLAGYFITRAPEIRTGLNGSETRAWLNWCDRERVNAKVAGAWLVERGDAAQAIELATAFFHYWYTRSSYREGIEVLEFALAKSEDVAPAIRARALNGLSGLYDRLDEYERAAKTLDQAKDLWEEVNDSFGVMQAVGNRALIDKGQGNFRDAISGLERAIELGSSIGAEPTLARWESNLGTVYTSIGDHARAAELLSRALARNRELGRELDTAVASRRLAMAMAALGDGDSAFPVLEEARAVFERLGAQSHLAYCLNSMGTLKNQQGDVARSEDYHAQALTLWNELGEPQGRAIALFHLGNRALARGDLATASGRLRESLSLSRPIGEPRLISWALVGFAGLALAANHAERAARLNACAQALAKRHGFQPDEAGDYRPKLRRSLGKARFDAAWKAGSTMSLDDALAEIEMITIANPNASTPKAAASAPVPISSATTVDHGLTERELDVLRQVAAGKTNAEIGEALFISPFTAKTHVANLLGKLGVESRAAASTWAAQHDLL
jgi:tetratricopeptide (TPR) repeat protein